MKLPAVVVGLFVAAPAYLSYKELIYKMDGMSIIVLVTTHGIYQLDNIRYGYFSNSLS
jgi:biopolymer transport protein ExbB/TolQ